MSPSISSWADPRVGLVEIPDAGYPAGPGAGGDMAAPIERLCRFLGWAEDGRGAFGAVVPPGARVLVKPNWVLHTNQGPGGMEPLVTHGAIIQAVTQELLRAAPGRVAVGDAPIQACDFNELVRQSGLDGWARELAAADPRFSGLHDFRRTKSVYVDGQRVQREDQSPMENFVLFDLGSESLLEPITRDAHSFRVTMYNPRLMARTHAPGRHQFLVAREVMDADVIINLPKLKTHKKAGITCALKNLIGINGNKEYLPHHRVGGSDAGGDCYPGRSPMKRALEFALDQQNLPRSRAGARLWKGVGRILDVGLRRVQGDSLGVEGSWSGNDTIWRTCLDLNRILLYGRADGTLADQPQRRVLHLVDAIVAGQGDGPLSPEPLPLGLLLAGRSAAAVDWVGSRLLGYEPEQIPITRHAFDRFRWPIAPFASAEVGVLGDLGDGGVDAILSRHGGPPVKHPIGWTDAAFPEEIAGSARR